MRANRLRQSGISMTWFVFIMHRELRGKWTGGKVLPHCAIIRIPLYSFVSLAKRYLWKYQNFVSADDWWIKFFNSSGQLIIRQNPLLHLEYTNN